LGISDGTVKLHMNKIIKKLGVKSRYGAMTMILPLQNANELGPAG
jgi:DNA-binding NarL/FixJ family response regulator